MYSPTHINKPRTKTFTSKEDLVCQIQAALEASMRDHILMAHCGQFANQYHRYTTIDGTSGDFEAAGEPDNALFLQTSEATDLDDEISWSLNEAI